ncbi:MAG: helix-turn-helix transcriptional regulator [Gammaproteobacteria bacterium]|nr:helix-turn-helix transcriptional regulator [Gammaproteobacteria bacterium]
MSQTRSLVDTLKQELRKQRITYRDVSVALDLSETSVKRLFSEEAFSLKRLEKVCELLHMDLSDLVHQMERNIELTTELSLEQEQELVSDNKLLLVALLLMNRLGFEDILRTYDIEETEGIRLLARLDRMKLIELQPGNRVKLMISPTFKWIPAGPIQKFFESKVQLEFLNSSFNGDGEFRVFVSGMIPRSANAEIVRKMQHLANEMSEMNIASETLPLDQRFGTSLMMAIRPWEIEVFQELRREKDERVFG